MQTRKHTRVSDADIDPTEDTSPDAARIAKLAASIDAKLALTTLADPSRCAAAYGVTRLGWRRWWWYAGTTRPLDEGEEWMAHLGVNAVQRDGAFVRSRRAGAREAKAAIRVMLGRLTTAHGGAE